MRTSRELILVERKPAMYWKPRGLSQWKPGSANFSNRPHLSITPTLAWSTHAQPIKQ
uniref:Hypersensitive-induced response protein 4 n=1 Tax=Rhizophora mucronata TaxID=61149 RepID=A0A2P2J704_RHIMU